MGNTGLDKAGNTKIMYGRAAKIFQDMLVFIAACIFFAWEIYALSIVHYTAGARLPDNYGNFERIRSSLESSERKEVFSFAVVGDTTSSATFHLLCNELRNEPLSFTVITGDFARRCGKSYHDFFKYECMNSYRLSMPVFLVPGNRDVDYDNTCNNNISISQFGRMYGPPDFCFEYAGCLFVGVCIFPSPASSADGLKFLETTLATRRKKDQKVFVFTHLPPLNKSGQATKSYENAQHFVNLVRYYKVDYVIASDYHGYQRFEYDNTIYLVSGGGGGDLDETQSFGNRHHAVIFTVDSNSVSEKIVLAPPDKNESNANALMSCSMTGLYPLLKKHPVGSIVVNLLIIILFFQAITGLLSKVKHHAVNVALYGTGNPKKSDYEVSGRPYRW